MHLSDVKIVEQKLAQTLMEDAAVTVVIVARDNLSQSHVPNAVRKTLFLFNREVIKAFFAETVLESKEARHKNLCQIDYNTTNPEPKNSGFFAFSTHDPHIPIAV
jgi:hypothetical protein